jgi:hypothetical protein
MRVSKANGSRSTDLQYLAWVAPEDECSPSPAPAANDATTESRGEGSDAHRIQPEVHRGHAGLGLSDKRVGLGRAYIILWLQCLPGPKT